MKKYVVLVMLLSMALLATPAHASYECQGTITQLGLGNDGTVVVQGPGGLPAIYLCSVSYTTSNGFGPDSCKAAYATLLAARLSGQSVNIFFNDNLTCSTQPAWTPWSSVYFVTF